MQFLTKAESGAWCAQRGATSAAGDPVLRPSLAYRTRHNFRERVDPNYYWLAGAITDAVQPFERCLVWIAATGVWRSRENLHLYYLLRHFHMEYRPLEDAPGHLLFEHERTDLVSFVFLALVNGWDAHVVPSEYYAHLFVSHDGWLEIASDDSDRIKRVDSQLNESTE